MQVGLTSLTSTLVGVAAMLLLLSVLVQVLQELYKSLRSARAASYTRVLQDTFGPWVARVLQRSALPQLTARTPFQFLRLQPQGILLPLDQDSLLAALERTAPGWVQRSIKQLEQETRFREGGRKKASPEWKSFVEELRQAADEEAPPAGTELGESAWVAKQVREVLAQWGADVPDPADWNPAVLCQALRRRFLGHLDEVERDYPQVLRNFEFEYRRRNLRLSFLIAFVVALAFDQPFQEIWRSAESLSLTEATAAAERAAALYALVAPEAAEPPEQSSSGAGRSSAEGAEAPTATEPPSPPEPATPPPTAAETGTAAAQAAEERVAELHRILDAVLKEVDSQGDVATPFASFLEEIQKGDGGHLLMYLLGCLLTAILLSFGAPFWNDLLKLLPTVQRGRPAPPAARAAE